MTEIYFRFGAVLREIRDGIGKIRSQLKTKKANISVERLAKTLGASLKTQRYTCSTIIRAAHCPAPTTYAPTYKSIFRTSLEFHIENQQAVPSGANEFIL